MKTFIRTHDKELLIGLAGLTLPVWVGFYFLQLQESFEFNAVRLAEVKLFFILFDAAMVALFCILFVASYLAKVEKYYVLLMEFLGLFSIFSNLLFPIPDVLGKFDLWEAAINKTNLALSIGFAVVACVLLKTGTRSIVFLGLCLFLLLSWGQAMWFLLSYDNTRYGEVEIADANNVFVISFDGVGGDVLNDVLAENGAKLNHIKDFTVFRNALSTSPATDASLAAELIGNRNFKSEAQTTAELSDIAKRTGVFRVFAEHGYQVRAYGPYLRVTDRELTRPIIFATHFNRSQTQMYIGNIFSRSLGRILIRHGKVRRFIERVVDGVHRMAAPLDFSSQWDVLSEADIRRSVNPGGDRFSMLTINDFHAYFNTLKRTSAKPNIHFLHMIFTHFPVDFDENCIMRSDDRNWFDSHQTHEGVKGETVCAVAVYERFLERLVELGVYDSSYIVLKSDHGVPVQWANPDTLAGLTIRNNQRWGFGRYPSVLMIKKPGQKQQAVRFNANPVILDDLAHTLCRHIETAENCALFNGIDLFSDASAYTGRRYFTNIVKDARSSFPYDEHETIELPRAVPPLRPLREFLRTEMMAAPLPCGSVHNLTGYGVWGNIGWYSSRPASPAVLTVRVGDCDALTVYLDDGSGTVKEQRVILSDAAVQPGSGRPKVHVRRSGDGFHELTSDAPDRIVAFTVDTREGLYASQFALDSFGLPEMRPQ
jgi:hypothetical protein